ncbi:hypothetical protein KGQ20_22545 [Catenulispora sp. NF23]|uniref:hypothetical protein n=1 Tax=Catenulispora pinistramenti TaxID=2705254 RepID=UPI001BAD2E8C|nr:hypothetical protein [Catenulispora pinistramenti]MBS2535546.1 hypothetical protein [Catenulispora pinistramenti]
MRLSKYLCAVVLIASVAGCHSSTSAAPPSPSADPVLPQGGPVQRLAELSYSGGFHAPNALAPPTVAVYSDGVVVFGAAKKLTLTPGALAVVVSALQPDLAGQPGTVLQPKDGHPIPDAATTAVGVLQPGGKYQLVHALGLAAGREGQYPVPVADAFDKLQKLTTYATTPYTATRVRYAVQCPTTGGASTEKPWPTALPQPGAGQPGNCLEVDVADGAAAAAVRAACVATAPDGSSGTPPGAVVYRAAKGLRICSWRYALPDEA